MGRLKDKLINLFFEENNEDEEIVEVDSKVLIGRTIMACSIILNFILNILYVSLFCYSRNTKNIGLIVFIISFIWTIMSLVSSYRLYGKYSRLLFYINLIIILFISKIWFVYF